MNLKSLRKQFAVMVLTVFVFSIAGCELAERNNPYDPGASGYVRAVYVNSTRGDDNYPGSMEKSLKSIQAGINRAKELWPGATSEVRVAAGTYTNAADTTRPVVTMEEGISLMGGYSAAGWGLRDASANVTKIQDESASAGTLAAPNRAVDCGTGLTNATVINGFTICAGGGGSAGYSVAVYCSFSSPTISGCVIDGGTTAGNTYGIFNYHDNVSAALTAPLITGNRINGGVPVTGGNCYSYGIYNSGNGGAGCIPVIKNNTLIYGGDGQYSYGISNYNTSTTKILITGNCIEGGTDSIKSTSTYGIYNYKSSPMVINNTIYAGNGIDILIGIYIDNTSSPKIYNNTINGGIRTNPTIRACCIFINGTSSSNNTVIIENNILLFSISLNNSGWGIYEANDYSNPGSVRNNDVYNVGNAYLYHDYNPAIDMCGISSGNFVQNADGSGTALATPAGTANIKADPVFDISGDGYHLCSSSPASVRGGGIDLSGNADFPAESSGNKTDKDSRVRTVPWSIGAYEY